MRESPLRFLLMDVMVSPLYRSAPPASGVASPCVSVCRMDESTGWCEGCWRTIDEIATWSRLDDAAKRGILTRLEDRRAGAGEARANGGR